MKRTGLLIGLLLSLGAAELAAQSFSFYSTLRAGWPNRLDWQMGVGGDPTASTNTAYFDYDSTGPQFWRDNGQPQDFRIGWDAGTNTAYVSVYNENGTPTTVSYQNTGQQLGANTKWTLPASSFLATAANAPFSIVTPSIQLGNLSLSPNVALLSGTLPSTFGAVRAGSSSVSTLAAPLLLDASANGGSWFISGTVRFTGLLGQGGTARGSQLQFFLGALGTDTPEAGSITLLGAGLVAIGMLRRRLRNGTTK